MKIDAHQHFWHYSPQELGWITEDMSAIRRNFLPQDLHPLLIRAGFDASIAVQAAQTIDETRFLLDLAGKYPFIAGVVGWVDLQAPDVEDHLAQLALNKKLVGVRHVVQSEPDNQFLLRPAFINGIRTLDKFNLTYDILIYPKHLQVATRFVEQFPDQKFVLDHLAKPFIKSQILQPWTADIWALAAYENVSCKLSGMVTEADWQNWKKDDFIPYLDVALEAFGVNRLMIGSDWPVCTIAGEYREVMELVQEYIKSLSKEEQKQIMGTNAARFYGIRG